MKTKIISILSITTCILIAGIVVPSLFTPPSLVVKKSTLNTPFSLKIGESTNIDEPKIIIKFIDVLEDSRCPSDVQCVWEGTVSIEINIIYEDENLGNKILNYSNLHKVSFIGYYIKYLDLSPYPISTEIIEKGSYNASFVVSEYGSD